MATTSKGYDPNKDYSLAIKNSTSASERAQLQKERQAKIDDLYGGKDPYKGTSDIMGTGSSTSSTSSKSSSSSSSKSSTSSYTASSGGSYTTTSGSSYTKPTSGGTSSAAVTTYTPAASTAASTNYHQDAIDAAARGDWSAVGAALAARQAKIDADGGNDRGTSNAQILAQLKSQYGSSYDSLSAGMQDYVKLNAGEKLPYTTSSGDSGTVYKDQGWQQGVDYLAEAQRLAAAGDLDGAYDALMRRGFKMADTGSSGGGTSQDQAYAMIHQLYNQSSTARDQYQNEVDINRQRLQEHQTQFGLQTIPALANRQFLSTDGKYWVIYDANGTPTAARPNNQSSRQYSDEEIALMSQYYSGEAENFSELDRQLHNLGVVATGVGRLVDQEGNYASGTAVQPVTANDWTGLPQTDRYQDRTALQAILDQINSGTAYTGGSVSVPTYEPVPSGGIGLTGWSGPTGGVSASDWGGDYGYGYGDGDLAAYLRQMYQASLDAQLAQLQAAYEQNLAESRAHDDLIAQNYLSQRNQAAAQNDLQRMYMNEMGVVQGLNTGTAGQMALALGSDLQNSLAQLGSAEAQDLSESDLVRRQLGIGYRGDVVSAQASSSAGLAGALYSEYVRQMEAAREEARWQAQMAYQRQQDALAQANWERQFQYNQQADRQSGAYTLAAAMLKNGVMPDSATLAEAGISAADAQAMAAAQQAAAAAKSSTKSSAKSGSTSGSGGAQDYSALFQAALSSGTPKSFIANNYKKYGFTSSSGLYNEYQDWSTDSGRLNTVIQGINGALTNGNTERADGYIRSVWDTLSGREKEELQSLLSKYGVQYTP